MVEIESIPRDVVEDACSGFAKTVQKLANHASAVATLPQESDVPSHPIHVRSEPKVGGSQAPLSGTTKVVGADRATRRAIVTPCDDPKASDCYEGCCRPIVDGFLNLLVQGLPRIS